MFAEVEDAIVSDLRAVLMPEGGPARVKTVESAPGRWSEEYLKRQVRKLPGVFVAWSDGDVEDGDELFVRVRWHAYVLTGFDGQDQLKRRRGAGSQAGAYALVEAVAGTLHNRVLPGDDPLGHLLVTRIENLYTGALESKAVSVFAVTCRLGAQIELEPALGSLDDFLRAGAGVDIDADGASDTPGEPFAIPQE